MSRTRNKAAVASQSRRTGARLRDNSKILENVPSQTTLDFGANFDKSSSNYEPYMVKSLAGK